MASPQRLTRTADLLLVRREGKRVRTGLLEVRVLASLLSVQEGSPRAAHRIGIVVPRHRHSAVDRNRLKRRLRELTRAQWPALLAGRAPLDVALYALPAAYAADFTQLRDDVLRLGQRAAQHAAAA
ncbi:MAG: ribonuclease P protein component [Gemmatimonadaceae bacterium]|nr:ribonuclease P protein component [Gemmatimonadaceae bacterium]MCW5826971.1 ribonuclease P protein component [Gemmatimonadaceae bacterium]